MIGLFNDCFPPIMDGVSLTTRNYAYWLHQKAMDVCVVTPKTPGISDNESYPVYRYSSLPLPMRKPYRLGFPRIDFTFHSHIMRLPFGLVHAHCPFSSGTLAMRIAHARHIPLVATFHSKYRSDFERAIPSKSLVNYLVRNVVHFYESADEVWIPQASVEDTLREYGYKGRVEVVDNGNDFAGETGYRALRERKRRDLNILSGEFMFLFVGQHIWEKNLRFLVEALARLKNLPYHMYFIGSGYAEGSLRKLVSSLDLDDKVIFKGTITDREELKCYYAAADLFLFPSLYDNAPLVVREAAAMNTPAVLVGGSTSAEIINDGENGFLSGNTPQEFAYKIMSLMVMPGRIKKAGVNASKTIARSWEDVAGEVCDRYRSIMARYKS
ncbi:glycosyltransferase [Coprobacter tertius]|uniref:Glycosyltransferase n=1 Tax=Coprobacter tertius TaxID=2944915 RepID=A0ABT1MJ31_9BACT|nr:glycosyltransferase [Coprobacter tertius]MCP9612628.1 glycosyltransferase [Coprobacter tertius]